MWYDKTMETTVVLVRHGESEGNISGKCIFLGDVALTPRGIKQAERTAQYVNGKYKFDVIVSSDLQRAVNTAQKIADLQGLPIIKDKRFREINAGDWEGLPYEETPVKYPKTYWQWNNDISNVAFEGGESIKYHHKFVNDALFDIMQRFAGKTILLVCHATPIRMMECTIYGKDLSYAQEIKFVPNASVTAFKYKDGNFTVIERGTVEHMADLMPVPSVLERK